MPLDALLDERGRAAMPDEFVRAGIRGPLTLESLDAAGNDAAADATIDLGACLRNPRLRRGDLSGNGFDPQQRARLGVRLLASRPASCWFGQKRSVRYMLLCPNGT